MDKKIIETHIDSVEFKHIDERVTICIAKTKNDFYFIGKSFCADRDTFSKEFGETYSYEDVLKQLEGNIAFLLKSYENYTTKNP
jgi:hypothetical protein